MIKKLLLSLLVPVTFFAQHQSIIEEQSNHYKNIQATTEAQWDSVNLISNGVSNAPILTAEKTQTTSCVLNKQVYGWHPYWNGTVYNNYDWSMLSGCTSPKSGMTGKQCCTKMHINTIT